MQLILHLPLKLRCGFSLFETVSQSENGLEKTYQGSAILVHWKEIIGKKETKMNKTLRLHLLGAAGVPQP